MSASVDASEECPKDDKSNVDGQNPNHDQVFTHRQSIGAIHEVVDREVQCIMMEQQVVDGG